MDIGLLKAARLGDVGLLNKLLDEDPLILEKSALSPTAGTPLHVAALAGKADFVHEIIIRKPSFAWKLNQDGFSPLHIAVAIGYGDVVQELLSFGDKDDVVTHLENSSRLCVLRDKKGLIPLHYAAIKGEVTIIEELVRCCPESLKELTTRGQTVLHLAVKNSQFEAFKALVGKLKVDDVKYFVDVEDNAGNKIFQMAVDSKQLQVLEYLQTHTDLGMNSLEIISSDQHGEGTDAMPQATHTQSEVTETETPQPMQPEQSTKTSANRSIISASQDMLLIASLIATVTYEAGLSPPATLSKDGIDLGKNCTVTKILFTNNSCPDTTKTFYLFMIFNTTGFFAAIGLLLFAKLPQSRFLLPVALISMVITYVSLSVAMSPKSAVVPIYVTSIAVFLYLGSTYIFSLILAANFLKLTIETVGAIQKCMMAMGRPASLRVPQMWKHGEGTVTGAASTRP